MATHPATLDPYRNHLAGQTLMRQVTGASCPRWMRHARTDPAQPYFLNRAAVAILFNLTTTTIIAII